MDVRKVKKALIEQRKMNLSGNLYHKTQLDFAYNTNHIEGDKKALLDNHWPADQNLSDGRLYRYGLKERK